LIALAAGRRLRGQRLAVSAPFHCSLMATAAAELGRVLEHVRFPDPAFPVVTSVDARVVRGGGELGAPLVRQGAAPVRWEETVQARPAFALPVAREVGPGRVLTGLMRRISPGLPAIPVGDAAGVARAREALA